MGITLVRERGKRWKEYTGSFNIKNVYVCESWRNNGFYASWR